MNLASALGRVPKWLLTAGSFLSVAVVWWVDYVTGPELSLFVFYVVPVVVLVWFVGRAAARALSAVAATAWFVADLLTGREYAHPAIPYWNFAEKLLFFLLVVELVAVLKRALEREKLARQEFFDRELSIAEQVQRRLLPQAPPRLASLEVAGICRPARGVGGDYYDFLPLDARRLGLAVGDVSGKGLSAALVMASLQGGLRSFLSLHGRNLPEVFADANRQLLSLTETTRFATLFFAVYDEDRRELAFVNAGHNPPMLFRGRDGGAPPERLAPDGPVLGLLPTAAWRSATTTLAGGDVLVVFTDGIPEATNGRDEEFGEARLARVVAEHRDLPAAELCDVILREVAAFLDGVPAGDDQTLLVARSRDVPGARPAA